MKKVHNFTGVLGLPANYLIDFHSSGMSTIYLGLRGGSTFLNVIVIRSIENEEDRN